ncbi:hypothetical protein P43SY_005601 [Pythium insidiosum]|uniref:Transmembrane protein n=1 Tax=Pythium insidiosum TaxID=114742 RepID=A0AAD5Q4P8_PYTIN|nr:hypothetical protein P43SY_005601 [Pythium insidiosum]
MDSTSDFSIVKSPVSKLEEGGALRHGGAPDLLSRRNVGLLAQHAALGVIRGTLQNAIYPFLFNYLRMSGVEVSSARALLRLIWTLKFFVGIITDSVPIAGFHRRPYILLGWTLAAIALLAMAIAPLPSPYYPDAKWAKFKSFTPEQAARLNRNGPQDGVLYLVLMVTTSFGLMVAITAADGVLVDFAQREPESTRGTTQTMTLVVMYLFAIVSACLTGLGMNGPEYGGSFAASLGLNVIMGICACVAVAMLPISWFCLPEERVASTSWRECRQRLRQNAVALYELLQSRVVYQIIAFRFLRNLFSQFGTTAETPVQSLWAGVEPLNDAMANIGTYLMSCFGMCLVKRFGLQWSWHAVIAITQVLVIAIDVIPTMLTIWNVCRSQWLWLGVPLLQDVPSHAGGLVASFVIIEIVEHGNEAAVYGLISTVSNLALPFSTMLYKSVDAYFDVSPADIVKDTTHVRKHVTYTYLIAYAVNLASIGFLVLLPRQKAETQALKQHGGSSRNWGRFTLAYLVFAFAWSLMTNAMTFSTTTSCMRIAGGSGCKKRK